MRVGRIPDTLFIASLAGQTIRFHPSYMKRQTFFTPPHSHHATTHPHSLQLHLQLLGFCPSSSSCPYLLVSELQQSINRGAERDRGSALLHNRRETDLERSNHSSPSHSSSPPLRLKQPIRRHWRCRSSPMFADRALVGPDRSVSLPRPLRGLRGCARKLQAPSPLDYCGPFPDPDLG